MTLIDGFLAVAVLVGLVLNAAAGLWWADSLVGLAIVATALETLPYPDYICVVPFLHATERAVCTGAVLESENQFGVGKGI